ncbi:unnamed protein product, partial [Prorocentrum cordatum]
MRVACSLACLGAVAAVFSGAQVQVLVLDDSAVVELGTAKAQRDEESCTAFPEAAELFKHGAEAAFKEQFIQLFGCGSVSKKAVAPPAAVANTSGVQEVAGAGALGGAPGGGEATLPAAGIKEGECAAGGAAGGTPGSPAGPGDASSGGQSASLHWERSRSMATGGEEEPDPAAPEDGPHRGAAGEVDPGGDGVATAAGPDYEFPPLAVAGRGGGGGTIKGCSQEAAV